jgi:hypothetical protein
MTAQCVLPSVQQRHFCGGGEADQMQLDDGGCVLSCGFLLRRFMPV